MKDFWLVSKSPKQIFKEFIAPKNPKASFWDIFSNYDLVFPESEPADTSAGWLEEQDKIIKTIIKVELAEVQMNQTEIDDFICALQEFSFPDEEQMIDCFSPNSVSLAKQISTKYIVPKAMNDATMQQFLHELENSLLKINQVHIMETNKAHMRSLMREIPRYSEEKKEEIVKNLEAMWNMGADENDVEDTYFEDDDFEKDNNASGASIWPELGLAYSQGFYGFDDADNLSYEEQEKQAKLKYEEFKDELSELLGQEPDKTLLPEVKERSDELWDTYLELAESNPFLYEFENEFAVWNGKDKVLFLILRKEDKELPYAIVLGGMALAEYQEILKLYNDFKP